VGRLDLLVEKARERVAHQFALPVDLGGAPTPTRL
jgi:hypothetical protein